MPEAPREWSTRPEENEAVDRMRAVIGAMRDTLYAVDGARYVDPAGGFAIDK